MPVEPDKLHLAALERVERRLEGVLRDLRDFRRELSSAARDKGVLGSRSLTEYVLGLLKSKYDAGQVAGGKVEGTHINDLLLSAESAGYAIPTRRIMSKRLTERNYRVGDIVCIDSHWYWNGEAK